MDVEEAFGADDPRVDLAGPGGVRPDDRIELGSECPPGENRAAGALFEHSAVRAPRRADVGGAPSSAASIASVMHDDPAEKRRL